MTQVCISSCVGALDWSASHLESFSRLLSLPRKAETFVCTHVCVGFLTASCGSCDTGQRALHCALHRAFMPVGLALAPLALLPDLFLIIALHKHPKYDIFIGSGKPEGWTPSRWGRGVALACSLPAWDGQVLSWPAAWPWYVRWWTPAIPYPKVPCKKDEVWNLPSSSCRGNSTLGSHLSDQLSKCCPRSPDRFYPWWLWWIQIWTIPMVIKHIAPHTNSESAFLS